MDHADLALDRLKLRQVIADIDQKRVDIQQMMVDMESKRRDMDGKRPQLWLAPMAWTQRATLPPAGARP